MGIRTGLITGRDSPANALRAREASMEFVIQGQPKKLEAYKAILIRAGVTDEEVAYIGDDLPDLPILERVGLAVAVANAVYEVKRAAHYITTVRGGDGAVRELVELILKAQGRWKKAIPQAIA
jgi:3-deoxy-D-manno-octulosonate 8-phosphate phosphatase (KDO 8-P phosphatase)